MQILKVPSKSVEILRVFSAEVEANAIGIIGRSDDTRSRADKHVQIIRNQIQVSNYKVLAGILNKSKRFDSAGRFFMNILFLDVPIVLK